MNSSTDETLENLAAKRDPSKLLDPLKDLANLQDDPASFERFARRWPVFARVLDDDPSENYVGFGGERWSKMPPSIPKRFFRTWQMREVLREIWGGNSKKLGDVLFPGPHDYPDRKPDPDWLPAHQLKVDWHRGEFVYIPETEFQGAVYELFRRSPFAKVCANRDCPAPYFIAAKTAQRYCSEPCAEPSQRAYKLRWWKEHGTEWRRKKSRRKRGKRYRQPSR